MLFKPELITAITEGRKTQTRRPIKPGQSFNMVTPRSVHTKTGRLKWEVGRDYAVQPGRGKPGVWWARGDAWWNYQRHAGQVVSAEIPLRIKITDIWREAVRAMVDADARAEGFDSSLNFWRYWASLYDPPALDKLKQFSPTESWSAQLWLGSNRPMERWADVWVLEFEVMR